MIVTIGIDPGLDGAIALSVEGKAPWWVKMPTIDAKESKREFDLPKLFRLLRDASSVMPGCRVHAFLERLRPMPSQIKGKQMGGFQTNYSRGRSLGIVEAFLVAVEVPYTLVLPQQWMKVMHAGVGGEDTKQKSILAAQRLFPSVSLMRTDRCRKPDDGIAEALLLSEYARRVLGQRELAAAPESRRDGGLTESGAVASL